MFRKKVSVLSLFMFISLLLCAKVNVGIEVMPQFSGRLSWGAGVNLEIPIGNKLYISPGIAYSSRHRYNRSLIETTEHHPEGDVVSSYEKASMNVKGAYINIPLLVGYKGYVGPTYTVKVAGGFITLTE